MESGKIQFFELQKDFSKLLQDEDTVITTTPIPSLDVITEVNHDNNSDVSLEEYSEDVSVVPISDDEDTMVPVKMRSTIDQVKLYFREWNGQRNLLIYFMYVYDDTK